MCWWATYYTGFAVLGEQISSIAFVKRNVNKRDLRGRKGGDTVWSALEDEGFC